MARGRIVAYLPTMLLPGPLHRATLIRRYKRFLADVTLDDRSEVTAHVANPGSMMGLSTPGMTVWLSRNDDPKRKLRYTWELASLTEGHVSGVSTAHPNRIVEEALRARRLPEFADYESVRREVKYGEASRVDFLLSSPGRPDFFVEVKNVHLRREGDWAEFPDAVTARGAKHLNELAAMVAGGARAAMLYVIQRTDCARFRLAEDIDPTYAAAYSAARGAGVEAYAYRCEIDPPTPGGACEIKLGATTPITDPSPRAGGDA